MKLYYFNPNNYGREYFTIGNSPSDALRNLKTHLYSKTIIAKTDPEYYYIDYYKERYNMWKKASVGNLPKDYSIEEYGDTEVIESELS